MITATSTHHQDRADVPLALLVGLAASTAVAAGVAGGLAARGQVSTSTGFVVGAALALLAVLGLASLSLRQTARVVVFVSAIVLVRFALLAGSVTSGGQVLLVWLVAAISALVLAEQVATGAGKPLGGPSAPVRARGASVARVVAVAGVVAVIVAVVLAPLVLPFVGDATAVGDGASLESIEGGARALRASESLDMTTRPDLTDEVVFTVEADRGAFWRGETFDTWNGQTWSRSDQQFTPLLPGDRLRTGDDDLGATGDDTLVQRIRIETSFAEVVYAAPSAVEVAIDRPVRQRPDGTLLSAPMGRGTTYTVTSRRESLSEERLRSVDDQAIPAAVLDQYAAVPVMTDRVRDLASSITVGVDTQYDQVRAIEAWMGQRVRYSLDAPLAPKGTDVVDHFLFEAEEGWCEQIASSLVVLARANGIPARLVTGFVPGERDSVTGTFTVRERDAHAWAEVWFPEVGWVPFDPTADVPLAGNEPSSQTMAGWLRDHAVIIVVGVVGLVLVVGPLRLWWKRRRAARAAEPTTWPGIADASLARLGARVDRPRRPDETATAHAAALAWQLGDARLPAVGRTIDDACYAPDPPPPEQRAWVDGVLEELLAAPASSAQAVPVP